METVSIIVPIYNAESYLERCVDSLIHQTYEQLEILLIDDGSTDGSGRICDRWSKEDVRIRVVHNSNHGCVFSRKQGVELATGRYVAFCDSDDYMDDNAIEEMYGALQQKHADVVVCGYYIDKNGYLQECINGLPDGLYDETREFLYNKMMFDFQTLRPAVLQSTCGKLFKKELLKDVLSGEDDRITLGEDAACVYPYLLCCEKIVVSNQCFYHYCARSNSMCTKKDIGLFQEIEIFDSYLKRKFCLAPAQYNLQKQLKAYLVHFLEMALKNNFEIDFSVKYCFDSDLFKKMKGKKVIIYGAGKIGKQFQREISQYENIVQAGWVDKNKKGEKIDKHEIISLEMCMKMDFDYVLVAVLHEKLYNEIKCEISAYVAEHRIIWAKPLIEPWTRIIEL